MLDENFYIYIIYPVIFILLNLIRKITFLKKWSGSIVAVALLSIFFQIFSSFFHREIEYIYLFLLSSFFLISVSTEKYKTNSFFVYYTMFWMAIFYSIGLIKFSNAIFQIGMIALVLFKKDYIRSFYAVLIWLAMIAVYLSIGKIGVVNGLEVKDYLLSVLYLLLFIFCVLLTRSNTTTLLLYPFSISIFSLLISNVGYVPTTFVYMAILLQGLYAINFLVNNDKKSILFVFLLFGVLSISMSELLSYFQLLVLIMLTLLLNLDYIIKSKRIKLILFLFTSYFMWRLIGSSAQFNIQLKVSSMFIVSIIFLNIFKCLNFEQKMSEIDFSSS